MRATRAPRHPIFSAPLICVALTLAAAAPAMAAGGAGRGHWGEEQALRFRLGIFEPRAESRYWSDNELDFIGGEGGEFEGVDLGVSYVRFLGRKLGLVFASDYYHSGEVTQSYRDFVDERGDEIFHDTELEVTRLTLGLLVHLSGRDARIEPYVGAGAGFYLWRLSEVGDFIDFGAGREIFFGDFEEDGAVFGYYLNAGLEVPVATNWSVFADVRWDRAEDSLGGDFAGLGDLDLAGRAYSLGVAVSF